MPDQPTMSPIIPTAVEKEEVHRLEDAAKRWSELKKAPTLLLWLASRDSLERNCVDQVFQELRSLPKEVETIWLVLNSSGGNLDAAYHIGRLLQARAKRVCALVPRWAKSAATMLTLGCHDIVMHPLAELGPLDVQVSMVRRHTRQPASALDAVKSIEYLRIYAADTFDALMDLCLNQSQADEQVGAEMAAAALSAIVQPIFAQVEPAELGGYHRLLSLAQQYGERLMARSYAQLDVKQRRQILNRIVEQYAAHSFVIDLKEASELGLNVRGPDDAEAQIVDDCSSIFTERELHSVSFIQIFNGMPQPQPVAQPAKQPSDVKPAGGPTPIVPTQPEVRV